MKSKMRTCKKRVTACCQTIVSKSLTSDFRLDDYAYYLGVLCPRNFRPRFYYVFVSEDKNTNLFHYTFIYTSKWLQSQSLRQFQVQPCTLVAFFNFDSIGLLI
nr:hypothetical protein TLHOJNLA_TLHOJNLA_CDS_0003 [Microvirus sp.]